MKRLIVPFDCKAVSDEGIEGYGSTFGNIDLGGDVVMPGAFARSLAKHEAEGTKPKMLWNHRSHDLPIGVWDSFEENEEGLWMQGRFADTQMGRDVRTLAKMRAIDSMSIGFTIVDADFRKDGAFMLKEIDLWEVSPVNFPMNPEAVIAAVKSQFSDPRTFERHLRDVGCSIKAAKTIVSDVLGKSCAMYDDPDLRDAEDDVILALEKMNNTITAGMIRGFNLRS
jgi:HK97 family phage prohead protease